MRITFIRHAEMAGDPFVRPERPVTGCLSEDVGVPQAEAAAKALAAERFDVAFSSPYGRALQTAEIVLAGRDIPIRVLDFLREWEPNPSLRDMPSTEHEEMLKRDAARHVEETWKTELGEGCLEFVARVGPPFLKELDALGIRSRMGGFVPEEPARDLALAVFAHGGTLGALVPFLLGMRPFPLGPFSFRHTGVATMEFVERRGIHYPVIVFPAPHEIGRDS